MNVLIFGATGMVGSGVLAECLEDSRVTAILAVGRSACGVTHPKLREHLRSDFFGYGDAGETLAGFDACFFSLGVSSAGMDEGRYRHLTFDLAIAAAEAVARADPGLTFCYVSGEGTDRTERGRFMWARVKGATENRLLAMPIRAYMFRPGFIQPRRGVRSKTRIYQAIYALLAPAYPILKRIFPTHMTTTDNLGRAMIEVAASGYSRRILENTDINEVAAGSGRARLSP